MMARSISRRDALEQAGVAGAAGVLVTGALVEEAPGSAVATPVDTAELSGVRAGDLVVRYDDAAAALHVATRDGATVQSLTLDPEGDGVSFLLPDGPLSSRSVDPDARSDGC